MSGSMFTLSCGSARTWLSLSSKFVGPRSNGPSQCHRLPQECPARVPHKSALQDCATRVLHKSVHTSVLQECPTRERPTRVFSNPARVPHKRVPCKSVPHATRPTRVSHKSVGQELGYENIIAAIAFDLDEDVIVVLSCIGLQCDKRHACVHSQLAINASPRPALPLTVGT